MNESQALDHLTQQLEAALYSDRFAACAGLDSLEVLDMLGAVGRRRVLAAAYLEAEPGAYWPAYGDAAELWSIVRRVLTTPEPRSVSTCPPWCDEHGTAERHSVLEDDRDGTGYAVAHHAAYGPHLTLEVTENALTATGPTLPEATGTTLLLIPEEPQMSLTAAEARDLARHLLAAAQQLDQLEPSLPAEHDDTTTSSTDTEENHR